MEDKVNPLQDMIDEHAGQQFEAPMAYYEMKFSEADPTMLSARSGVAFTWRDAAEKAGIYEVHLLGRPLAISWPDLKMTYTDTGEEADQKVYIIIADMLLNGQLVPSAGSWKAYSEIPWGEHYLKAFQGRCIMRLAYMFKDRESFAAACEKLGGVRASDNDDYYEFDFLNGVKIRLALWEADEEFGPTAQILFSDNAQLALSAEDLAAAGDIILGALKSCRS